MYLPIQVKGQHYSYKVKFLASNRKAVVREIYNYHDEFDSVNAIRQKLKEEFSEHVAQGSNFSIGYFEGRHQTKRWLISLQDVEKMYEKLQGKPEIFLWSDGKDDSKTVTEGDHEDASHNRKRPLETTSKRQEKEEEVEAMFCELKDKHSGKFSVPQLRLWARMVANGIHDDLEEPPQVPMITGITPKRAKKETLSDVLTPLANAITKAFTGNQASSTPEKRAVASQQSSQCGISPAKVADIRMKNLEQLKFLQQLYEDGILSHAEFIEQKGIILDLLRKLN